MAKSKSSESFEIRLLQDTLNDEFGKRNIAKTEIPDSIAKNINPAMQLRPYQKECFQYFLNYWNEDFDGKEVKPQILFHMATGSGKTLIMAGLILYLYEQGYRNFLFFVNSTNVIEKTKDNFLNSLSMKYLFTPSIEIKGEKIQIKKVENFQNVDDNCINLCLTTIQGLHDSLNTPHENSITYDDFKDKRIIMISDEAHHMNSATKKGKKAPAISSDEPSLFSIDEMDGSADWETTVMRIFRSNSDNALFEFTATEDFYDLAIAQKYDNKVLFDYPLKKFREDGYSKDIEVVQSDLLPIERAIQTVILSQYKRKLFESIGQDIKPVMMLKSKTKNENATFYTEFISAIKSLNEDTLSKIKERANGDIAAAFSFFEEKKISADNLLLELQEDFKEENLLLVDGNNISPEKQTILNSLEAKDNEYRVVFAVDMLNEGWDVLNLYDIVRLYDTRDTKGQVGKTTMQEAQLIGRGARYMPFNINSAPSNDNASSKQNDKQTSVENKPAGMRKFDDDITNRLRAVEKLHYHSAHNPKYVSELKTAMIKTGIVAEKTKEIHLKIKDSFKHTKLYKDGYVFGNKRESYLINENTEDIGKDILAKVFKVKIHSGEMQSTIILDSKANINQATETSAIRTLTLKELGNNVLRCAINRLNAYSFKKLQEILISLNSIDEFIKSDKYLANIKVELWGKKEVIWNLTQRQKLSIAGDVLMQIEPMFGKSVVGFRGSRVFDSIGMFKDIFGDKVIKITLDDSSDKEIGKSMMESNIFYTIDLSQCDWYVFNDCYGTSEEKYFVKYFESIVPKLKEKYEDVYLVRNERQMRIYEFKGGTDGGRAFEPDFLLFLKKKGEEKGYENYQIFIEPKGGYLAEHDKWKQDYLAEINEQAYITFSTLGGDTFRVLGLPFYMEDKKSDFDKSVKAMLGVGAW